MRRVSVPSESGPSHIPLTTTPVVFSIQIMYLDVLLIDCPSYCQHSMNVLCGRSAIKNTGLVGAFARMARSSFPRIESGGTYKTLFISGFGAIAWLARPEWPRYAVMIRRS